MTPDLTEHKRLWKPFIPVHGQLTPWLWAVWYPENFECGEYTDIGAFTFIQAELGVKIGKSVKIGSHCAIYSMNSINQEWGPVVIEDEAWIGSHSIIFPGTTIPSKTFIKAGSIVNKENVLWMGQRTTISGTTT
jgi:acetyltransferase-like isoleucine patch superfamily enzyme